MKVQDLNKDYIYVQDSQDIKAILEMVGQPGPTKDYGCLFVDVWEGEIWEVWGLESNIPYLHMELDLVFKR